MKATFKSHHVRLAAGLLLCAGFAVQCRQTKPAGEIRSSPEAKVPSADSTQVALAADSGSDIERLAKSDPLGFFKTCLAEYDRGIRDYQVNFTKQERLDGRIVPEQVTQVRFRESPYSVDMVWTRNPGRASRVLYVHGARVDKGGRQLALIKPSGILGGIGIKVERDIHGPDAGEESRRFIDQFGFRKTLELIIHYSEKAQATGELSLAFMGEGTLDERPTYVFERRLPYTGDEALYPDKLLVVHVDQEWLLPTGCFSYSDDAGKELLGKYLLTDATFNLGYSAADFDPAHMSF